jgi:NAD(P)-dependent dehydrogenase (short-subunit alcohol dehydrogenase family)
VAEDDFRHMLELKLTSVFVAMQHEIAAMLETGGGGAIVNMSPGSGFRAAAGMGPDLTAKHGLQGLTKVAALDNAEQGISINAIALGPIIAGPLAEAGEEFQRMAADSVPMRRIGRRGGRRRRRRLAVLGRRRVRQRCHPAAGRRPARRHTGG